MSLGAGACLLAAVCACCVQRCVAFPNGSVALSCGNMMPVHPPFSASTSEPPFSVSTSGATYTPGGVITVTVDSATEFQGFLLQARSRKGNALLWPLGKFTDLDPSTFTALHCNNMQNSTVSQASGAKKKRVQATWEAPSNSNYGDVFFSVTLVQDYTTFWVQMNSSSLRRETGNSAAGLISSSALLVINLLSLRATC